MKLLNRKTLVTIFTCCASASIFNVPVAGARDALVTDLALSAQDLAPVVNKGPYRIDPLATAGRSSSPASKSTNASDVVCTLSVENFQGTQANLSYTHESAAGFRNYLAQWYTPNCAYQDSTVGVWQFHDNSSENYDKWNSGGVDLGIDGSLTAWQSSHGGMYSSGTYVTSLGYDWAGRGWNATSNKMVLGGNDTSFGDETLRYMFWDTCQSIKYSTGYNPYSTWGARAKGIRMIFGYETNSIDSPSYGQYFWEEWNKGKSFSTAFLDASWRIYTPQSPVAMAFGSTSTEASNILNSERYLYWNAASSTYGAWRWYYASSAARETSSSSVPSTVTVFKAAARGNTDAEVRTLAQSLGIPAQGIEVRPFGLKAVLTRGTSLVVEPDGDFELSIHRVPVGKGGQVIEDGVLVERARALLEAHDLAGDQELAVGLVRYLNENSGSAKTLGTPRTLEKSVIFDQVMAGMPFIDADSGHVEITFDAVSGEVKGIRSTLRRVSPSEKAGSFGALSLEEARDAALDQALVDGYDLVPDTEEVGYMTLDGKLEPVFRVLLEDPAFDGGRPLQVIVPLAS